ncbi:MAG: hypothetical protein JNK82_33045 [Myxococcaceae bacterium]|nr:hypothetical protein [Myxococcaceae bacterium]
MKAKCLLVVVSVLSGCLKVTAESPSGAQQQLAGPDAGQVAPEREEPVAQTAPARSEAQGAPECASPGSACGEGGCCAGLYCLSFTYAPPTCQPQLADGASCLDASQCVSGACTLGRCGTATCQPVGGACGAEADCCAGSFCFDFTYAPPTCRRQHIDGSACDMASECLAGVCTNGRCGALACSTDGQACDDDSGCCPGSFCFTATYAPPVCTAPMPEGAPCWERHHCATGRCEQGACAP